MYAARVLKSFKLGDPCFTIDHLHGELRSLFRECPSSIAIHAIELSAIVASRPEPISTVQRNAATPKDFKRLIPEPIVVVVGVNGHPARALLDTGSLADFISSKLAHQLSVQTFELAKPLPVHLAVQGSRAKINTGCRVQVTYQSVSELRYFDVVNLLNYDLILGTPFMFQHCVTVGLNPATVVIGSDAARPIAGQRVRVLESRATEVFNDHLERARTSL
ncbi:hypothetical protein CERSUDRAFT_54728, partial [Gelatoporia subvermispora B]